MNIYSAVKHSFHKLQKGGSTPPPRAKQPGPGSPNPIRPLEVRRNQAAYARRRKPQALHLQDCGKEWGEMRKHLVELEGLDFLPNGDIVAVSRLGEKALGSVAQAIAILLEADHLEAASTLIRMCKPSVRLSLLELCEPDHIKKLTASNDAKVRETMDVALCAATRAAATRQPQDLPQFFKLLSYCSPAAMEHSMALFPSLTTDMLRGLDDQVLVQAVKLTLVRIRKENMDSDSSLVELVSLLSIADKLEGSDVPRAAVMKSILWVAMDPTGVLDPALCSKLEQLRSRIQIPALTPELLNSISAELRPEVEDVAKMQEAASHNLNECFAPEPELPYLLDEIDFKAAIRAGDLKKAASLMCDSPNETFRSLASEGLFVAVSSRLEEVGIHISKQSIGFKGGMAPKQRASVAREMAVVLAMTGKPSSTRNAETLLSLVDSKRGTTIQGVLLEGLGFPDRGDLSSQLRDALPTLCHADHASELNFILRTELGKRLVAQAVVDYFLQSELDNDTIASLFKVLGHRVDLRTTDLFTSMHPDTVNDRTRAYEISQIWADLPRKVQPLESEERLRDCIQLLDQWKSGWRVLLLGLIEPDFFNQGFFSISSLNAIDAAAADALEGGAKEGINDPSLHVKVQKALRDMLLYSVGGERPLLSSENLRNVMLAIVSNKDFAEETINWTKDLINQKNIQVQMYEAMANACLRLQHDLSPSRFNKALPANHAVADVASRLWNILPPSNMESLQQQIDEISTSIEGKKEPATSENNLRTLMAMEERLDKARRNVATLLVDVQDSMPGQAKGLINSKDLTTMQTLAGSQLISFA